MKNANAAIFPCDSGVIFEHFAMGGKILRRHSNIKVCFPAASAWLQNACHWQNSTAHAVNLHSYFIFPHGILSSYTLEKKHTHTHTCETRKGLWGRRNWWKKLFLSRHTLLLWSCFFRPWNSYSALPKHMWETVEQFNARCFKSFTAFLDIAFWGTQKQSRIF